MTFMIYPSVHTTTTTGHDNKNASFYSNRFVSTTQFVSNNNVSVWYNITSAMVVLVAHYAI